MSRRKEGECWRWEIAFVGDFFKPKNFTRISSCKKTNELQNQKNIYQDIPKKQRQELRDLERAESMQKTRRLRLFAVPCGTFRTRQQNPSHFSPTPVLVRLGKNFKQGGIESCLGLLRRHRRHHQNRLIHRHQGGQRGRVLGRDRVELCWTRSGRCRV